MVVGVVASALLCAVAAAAWLEEDVWGEGVSRDEAADEDEVVKDEVVDDCDVDDDDDVIEEAGDGVELLLVSAAGEGNDEPGRVLFVVTGLGGELMDVEEVRGVVADPGGAVAVV